MPYPPQGIDDDVLKRSKISDETWELLLVANNTKRMRKAMRRILKGAADQDEED